MTCVATTICGCAIAAQTHSGRSPTDDEQALHRALDAAGRGRFWDL